MPIFDDILSQPAVLISIGLAFLFIIAAVVLAVLPRIKASRVRAQRRKLAKIAAAQELAVAEAEQAEEVKTGVKRSAASKGATPSAPVVTTKTQTPSAPVATSGAPATAAASALTAALTGGTTDTKKEEVSPEMQDLLSSVFSEEENSERQAILLKGIEPIDIDELLTLSKAVAAQLHGEQPSNLVRVKENQLS